MRIRNWADVLLWAVSANLVLLVLGVTLTTFFEPEESLIDIIIQSASITFALCGPIFTFIFYQSMQLTRARDQLAMLVNRDRLTNVATRNAFYNKIEQMPQSHGVSLMVDIDHFKRINDTHGHLVGDEAIARVAQLIEACLRPQDIVCRFGGEEFLVFLSEATEAEGLVIAERIRQTVEEDRAYAGAPALEVTVSIGGAPVPLARDIDSAIRVADAALYRAKRGGRNRVNWAASGAEGAEGLRSVG